MPRLALLLPFVLIGCGPGTKEPTPAKPALPVANTVPTPPPDPEKAKPPVKLVVLVVFDQMRGDFLAKWQPHFGEGGFKRLQSDGAWFPDCHYPFGTTATGPGHSSMLSGASPSRTGIVNNEWYDRASAGSAYCAGTSRYELVPTPARKSTKPVGTPDRMLSPTLGDEITAAKRGKVFGLSLKDRSGILPSGKKPDGVYWFTGQFVTSTYYRDTPHPWADEFNKSGAADAYLGKEWVRLRSDLDYDKLAGPDDGTGEGKGNGQGVGFPHPTGKAGAKGDREYYEALANSPFGNDLLLDFTKTCVAAEKLGQRDGACDLLTVSFSSNDLIGHTWGPDSHEVLDATLRSDALMAKFTRFLDESVGKGQWAMVVTADHGICPLPEFSAKQGKDAKRVSANAVREAAEAYLRATIDKNAAAPTAFVEAIPAPYIYLNHKAISAKNLKPEQVADDLAGFLRGYAGVHAIYTHAQLKAGAVKPDDEIGQRVLKAFHPDRSGDLYVVMKPLYLLGGDATTTGTNHGSPHDYDTHSAFLAYGPGIAGGKRDEKVTPLHAAAILAHFAGVPKPKDAEYDLPKTLLAK